MNFYQQELKKLFGDGTIIESPQFAGRVCTGKLGKLAIRAEFVSTEISNHYSALRLSVICLDQGKLDQVMLRFSDLWGTKTTSLSGKLNPHIWDDYGKAQWYLYQPTPQDYQVLREAVDSYLAAFRERKHQKVYICVSEENPSLAKAKIAEVFAEGNIPMEPIMVCDLREVPNTAENRRKIIDECQQICVFGADWTDQMWGDIRYALKHEIPIYTDQDIVPGGRPIRLDEEPPKTNNKPKRKKDAYER